ncbi:MAG TPA: transcriptional regulator GutM [Ktedonobacterales bacterium]|nr:transcriptional regulator GutM [Ktedonobacterales bacterium]
MDKVGMIVAILLIVTWTLQMVLSLIQVRRYFKGVNKMRRYGRVATGMGGTRYRGRVYGVLAVDTETKIVTKAMRLSGITVFAGLKPVPVLEGISLDQLIDDPNALSAFSSKVATAFRAAAQTLHDSFQPQQTASDAPASQRARTSLSRRTKKSVGVRPATTTGKE